ncbi:hypothetical protein EI555_009198 [Monodon monoceros]|uniref:Uncharacterized protein n=1 Tax=Monodon monoceros TaxID=40151 RepID=A0A4U1FFU9_MONMO|nr:hypothetical protein EI555_009198 [Monodon monoceros]
MPCRTRGDGASSAGLRAAKRHGLAVCLALTTMCTSLLLVYSSLGGQKERPPQQQQAAATGSPPPHPEAPAGPRPLDGYLGVADHKVGDESSIKIQHKHLLPKVFPDTTSMQMSALLVGSFKHVSLASPHTVTYLPKVLLYFSPELENQQSY